MFAEQCLLVFTAAVPTNVLSHPAPPKEKEIEWRGAWGGNSSELIFLHRMQRQDFRILYIKSEYLPSDAFSDLLHHCLGGHTDDRNAKRD